MTRKNFLAHYTAFVQFALKLAKVARESGVETLGHVVEDLEETEIVFKEGLRIILTEPENGAIADEILTNMTTHERDKYKRLYMTIQKRAVLGIQAGEGPYILHKVLMSLVNLTPKETRKIENVLFFSDEDEPATEEDNNPENDEKTVPGTLSK
jgi:flagellar motor component MotA